MTIDTGTTRVNCHLQVLRRLGRDLRVPAESAQDLRVPAESAQDLRVPAESAQDLRVPAESAQDLRRPVGRFDYGYRSMATDRDIQIAHWFYDNHSVEEVIELIQALEAGRPNVLGFSTALAGSSSLRYELRQYRPPRNPVPVLLPTPAQSRDASGAPTFVFGAPTRGVGALVIGAAPVPPLRIPGRPPNAAGELLDVGPARPVESPTTLDRAAVLGQLAGSILGLGSAGQNQLANTAASAQRRHDNIVAELARGTGQLPADLLTTELATFVAGQAAGLGIGQAADLARAAVNARLAELAPDVAAAVDAARRKQQPTTPGVPAAPSTSPSTPAAPGAAPLPELPVVPSVSPSGAPGDTQSQQRYNEPAYPPSGPFPDRFFTRKHGDP
jgi:hypothetical protein